MMIQRVLLIQTWKSTVYTQTFLKQFFILVDVIEYSIFRIEWSLHYYCTKACNFVNKIFVKNLLCFSWLLKKRENSGPCIKRSAFVRPTCHHQVSTKNTHPIAQKCTSPYFITQCVQTSNTFQSDICHIQTIRIQSS